MRIALVHYWLVNYRGGEKVIENLLTIYPEADLFTLFWEPDSMPASFKKRVVGTSFLNRFGFLKRNHRYALPLMPLALEQLDLRGYDVVISSESGPAKGVITDPETVHICYCHSPMRYIWDMYHNYRSTMGFFSRLLFTPLAHYIRIWDRASAHGVDHFIANSSFIARRIKSCYRRDAQVIHPPVDLKKFERETPTQKGDYFFVLAELVPYKRIDLAVKAFNTLGLPLIIAGQGPELKKLQTMAQDNITFLGRVDDYELAELYAKARAFIFPGKEDFGITPLEANTSGTPVIAYAAGGILETQNKTTAVFFNEQTAQALEAAVVLFKKRENDFSRDKLKANATLFGEEVFKTEIQAFVANNATNARKMAEEETDPEFKANLNEIADMNEWYSN